MHSCLLTCNCKFLFFFLLLMCILFSFAMEEGRKKEFTTKTKFLHKMNAWVHERARSHSWKLNRSQGRVEKNKTNHSHSGSILSFYLFRFGWQISSYGKHLNKHRVKMYMHFISSLNNWYTHFSASMIARTWLPFFLCFCSSWFCRWNAEQILATEQEYIITRWK